MGETKAEKSSLSSFVPSPTSCLRAIKRPHTIHSLSPFTEDNGGNEDGHAQLLHRVSKQHIFFLDEQPSFEFGVNMRFRKRAFVCEQNTLHLRVHLSLH